MARNNQRSASGSVRRSVVEAYRRSLKSRTVWAGFASMLSNSETRRPRDEAHTYLHAATMQYFEAVQPYLASAPSGSRARDFWERAPLWVDERLTQPGVRCQSGHQYADPGAAGQKCPECAETLEAASVPDENGRCRWLTGLRNLQVFVDQTDQVEVEGGKWSHETEIKQVPKLIEPDALLRCARYIDESASDLGLLADVKEERPKAEVK